jgi:alpha-N-acetylglucosamine transferase
MVFCKMNLYRLKNFQNSCLYNDANLIPSILNVKYSQSIFIELLKVEKLKVKFSFIINVLDLVFKLNVLVSSVNIVE